MILVSLVVEILLDSFDASSYVVVLARNLEYEERFLVRPYDMMG